jgi:hypothetical protein
MPSLDNVFEQIAAVMLIAAIVGALESGGADLVLRPFVDAGAHAAQRVVGDGRGQS